MEEVIQILKNKYPNTSFLIVDNDEFLNLIYDNADLKEDDEFFNFVYDIMFDKLEDKDLDRFSVVYDYLDEITLREKEEVTFSKEYLFKTLLDETNEILHDNFISFFSQKRILTVADTFDKKDSTIYYQNIAKKDKKRHRFFNSIRNSCKVSKDNENYLDEVFDEKSQCCTFSFSC